MFDHTIAALATFSFTTTHVQTTSDKQEASVLVFNDENGNMIQ